MNGNSFLADTNAVLYFMSGNACMDNFQKALFSVSVISRIELFSWKGATAQKDGQIKKFLSRCEVFNLTAEIETETIKLRRMYNLKLPDAIIAATALCNDLPLLSADKIFSRVQELNFILLEPVF